MKYYIFDEVDPNVDAPFLDLPDEIDMIETLMGKEPNVETLPIKIEADIDEDEEVVYTDIINPGVPFVSQKVKDTLESCGIDNIHYYPVQIIHSETQEVLNSEYYLAIVKDIIACVDTDKSSFEQNQLGNTVITRFVIDPERTRGLQLFRFHNIIALIIITEELKKKLEEAGFVGVSFKSTDEYKREV